MPKRLTLFQVKKFFKKEGYKLLGEKYRNAFQRLKVKCPKGHIRFTTVSQFYKKQKCSKCSTHGKFSLEEVRYFFKKEKYLLLSKTYVGVSSRLSVKCPDGHGWTVTLNKFKNLGQRCPACSFSGGTSKMEKELFDIVKNIHSSAKKVKRRGISIAGKPHISGFDIDVFVPELRKGIEFDGKYFHSVNGLKRSYPNWPLHDIQNYHTIKDRYFRSEGISLLHVGEDDWLKDRKSCIDKCLNFLKGMNNG